MQKKKKAIRDDLKTVLRVYLLIDSLHTKTYGLVCAVVLVKLSNQDTLE